MLYAERDEQGNITSLSHTPQSEQAEAVSLQEPAVTEFLTDKDNRQALHDLLKATDADLARVTEDLIDVLVEKGVIMMTDLPEAARQKLITRRQARLSLSELIVDPDDLIL
ncbi:MAG: hypothetical protein P8Y64_03185 [Gammaproteobacteria bacterium]